ncbi:MAG: ABC transporter ATP-binding protein [Geminicoccaceae bacterium]
MSGDVLVTEAVTKTFDAVTAANDVSVNVPRGAVWSLIGSNGAGKTTFVNMVTGYVKPDNGQILFENIDITSMSPREITRLGIRRSFQIPQLCAELSVLENMLVSQSLNDTKPPSFWQKARSASDVDRAMETLKKFHIADNHDRLMGEISAGVRKLLDIAMAISGTPKVMLLDEPTSGVAAEEKFPIMDLVMEVLRASDVTILFVEHDMEIVTRYSERVLAFYDGRIVANDAPDDVLADEVVQRYVTGTAR